MTLEQLRIFVAVAEREHVTRAAADLNLTQSATSAAVATLEARYATKLFDRVGRHIYLTDAGRLFLVEAKGVLARAEAAELMLADLAGLKLGSLGIAASQTVGNYWLPKFISSFQSLYPGVSVTLTMGNTETVAASVREGVAKIGFVEGKIDDPFLSITPVADDELLLLAPPGQGWSQHGSADNLAAARWVLREAGSGTRSVLHDMLRKAKLSVKDIDVALVLPSNEAVRTAVENGAGVTVLSRLVVAHAVKAGALTVIDYPVPSRKFYMLRHKEHYITAAEQEFIQLIVRQ